MNSVHLNAVLKLESNHLDEIHIKPNMCTIYTIKIGMRAVLSARDVHAFTPNMEYSYSYTEFKCIIIDACEDVTTDAHARMASYAYISKQTMWQSRSCTV